jgi:hypothetical protein
MKQNLHRLINSVPRPFFALLVLLAASPMARAIAIFPANVQNKTPVAVEINVVRVQTQLGKPNTTNETKVTIQPGQSASVMIMGGTFGTGASFTKQITISDATARDDLHEAKAMIFPLILDKPASTMARDFIVSIDAKTSQFTFEPLPAKPAEDKAGNSGADPTVPSPVQVKPR